MERVSALEGVEAVSKGITSSLAASILGITPQQMSRYDAILNPVHVDRDRRSWKRYDRIAVEVLARSRSGAAPTHEPVDEVLDVTGAAKALGVTRGEVIELIRTHKLGATHRPRLQTRGTACARRCCDHWSITAHSVRDHVARMIEERLR